MKPPPFAYLAPTALEEALEALAEHGYEAKPLAGGQSLIPMLNFRLARPSVLVDLNRIEGLSEIQASTGGGLRLGAMVRQRAVERSPLVAERAPLLAAAIRHVAHPQIRNRGTVGGSAAHADPAAELPAVLVALEASFRIRDASGERSVPAPDFFAGLFTTALEPEELLVGIEIPPMAPGTGWAFEEVARRHGDYALMAVAAVVRRDEENRCADARLVYVNAGPRPMAAEAAADRLRGAVWGEPLGREVGEIAAGELEPAGDVHASADYRLHLARILTRRAVERAFRRATGAGAAVEP